jgi:uncharacterized repeat protein (TIGR01451 family)
MKTLTRSISATVTWSLLLSVGLFFPDTVSAQDGSEGLRIAAVNLTALEQGREPEEGARAPISRPGDVIEYRLAFTNTRAGAIRDLVFDDPIPQGLVYVLGSAGAERDDALVEFSIDGGATYGVAPEIEIQEAGRTVRIPAPPDRYTHIRWIVQGAVAPGEEVRAVFRATIGGGFAPPTPTESGSTSRPEAIRTTQQNK